MLDCRVHTAILMATGGIFMAVRTRKTATSSHLLIRYTLPNSAIDLL